MICASWTFFIFFSGILKYTTYNIKEAVLFIFLLPFYNHKFLSNLYSSSLFKTINFWVIWGEAIAVIKWTYHFRDANLVLLQLVWMKFDESCYL